MKQVIMYVLPAAGCTEAPSQYSTRPLTRLAQLDKHWYEFIPDPQKKKVKSSKMKSYNVMSNNFQIILSQISFLSILMSTESMLRTY